MLPLDQQLAVIQRGVEQIERLDELKNKLQRSLNASQPLRVKFGIDPTSIDVHLGHTVPLRKLRQFQQLGHRAVLIIGNYTALVGDPSGRDQTRARLTPEKVEANARDYLKQVSRIIDIERTEVTHNGDWFGKLNFLDVMNLTSKITMQQMLAREDFHNRIEAGKEIRLHECLYPLMQGHDSVAVRADIEIGGTDQLFNFMVARDLQRDAGQEAQVCITMPILRGLDGVRRMGKSLGNYIGVGEPAQVQFDKTMSIPDELMKEWFELLTDRPAAEIATLVSPQTHPMEAKKTLAADIVTFYYGADAAKVARGEWEKRFSGKQDPTDIPEVVVSAADLKQGKMFVCKLLVQSGLATSNSEARRLIEQGGINMGPDRTRLDDPKADVAVTDGMVIRRSTVKVVRVRVR